MDKEELCRRLEEVRNGIEAAVRHNSTVQGLRRDLERVHSPLSQLITALWKADDFTIETGNGHKGTS
jgi:hypothetical protein